MEQVAEGVYRLGSKWVNFYLVEESGGLTLIDAGFLGYVPTAMAAIRELGRSPSDVKAIVLTHTHVDHIGGADRLTKATGAPVFTHVGEAKIATGDEKSVGAKGLVPNLWRPTLWSFLGHAIANKGGAKVTVPNVTGFEGDEVLEVPGTPRVIYAPGHSIAHSALLLEDRRVLFSGDAMATLAVHTGETGPMVHPFNRDRPAAIGSLDVLEKVDADLLLPGHGEPWRGSVSEAVSQARRR